MHLVFWFDHSLEARTEICKHFHCYFLDYLKTRKSSSEIYWPLVMVAFLNSWMHAWKKTEIGLYSPAADFKKSSMAFFFCFHICLACFCAEGAAHIYNVARKRAQLGFKIFLKCHFNTCNSKKVRATLWRAFIATTMPSVRLSVCPSFCLAKTKLLQL